MKSKGIQKNILGHNWSKSGTVSSISVYISFFFSLWVFRYLKKFSYFSLIKEQSLVQTKYLSPSTQWGYQNLVSISRSMFPGKIIMPCWGFTWSNDDDPWTKCQAKPSQHFSYKVAKKGEEKNKCMHSFHCVQIWNWIQSCISCL